MKTAVLLFFRTVGAYLALACAAACFWLSFQHLQFASAPALKTPSWNTDEADLKKKTDPRPLVVVDAGHGGHDGGAVANGLIEKNVSLQIANALVQELEACGLRVKMTRQKDEFIALEKRADMANETEADAFVSVHLNTSTGEDAGASGIETYYSGGKGLSTMRLIRARYGKDESGSLDDQRGKNLAEVVQRVVCKRTGAENRGVKERGYTVVFRNACPAVLVECGFLTDKTEADRLRQSSYRAKIAKGIAEGVCAYLQARQIKPQHGLVMNGPSVEKPPQEIAGDL